MVLIPSQSKNAGQTHAKNRNSKGFKAAEWHFVEIDPYIFTSESSLKYSLFACTVL